MNVKIAPSWQPLLQPEFEKPYFAQLAAFVKAAYGQSTVYPPGGQIFNAFNQCSLDDTRVVILGQDPYHGPGQANGLSFSVADGVKLPPSLANIFKELENDLSKPIPKSGNLARWAKQGVLLLNSTLTVEARKPRSHHGQGWENFTQAVVKLISQHKEGVVFVLWGKDAQKRGEVVDTNKHYVIKSAHPSPYSASSGFFGSRPFSRANEYLERTGQAPIDW